MKRSACLFFLLFLFYFSSSAQSTNFLKGKVVDDTTKMPIANCSVFINSTSKGTVTNNKGEFILENLPEGNHELIISSIGYQTFVYDYSSAQLPLDVRVSLKQKTTELSEITVEPEVKDGWHVWGQTFLNNFIGTTENAKDCSIKNTGALHFRFSQKNNRLTVIADEPLVIENKALGYTVKYQLEEFYV
ncbi:MAG TPA: carboxypeptidase-like regulatory domain-containing protein, partial [Puia sp.]|nr:carboxypeptidase-like regulatory domain-containing protein [Puia sp.]